MRQILTSLVLVGMLVAGFWPALGEAITPSPGFGSFTPVSGLTDPHELVPFPPFGGFPPGFFVVEKSLNRVSVAPQGSPPTPFATGLSAPTDLIAPRDGGSPFGQSLGVVMLEQQKQE